MPTTKMRSSSSPNGLLALIAQQAAMTAIDRLSFHLRLKTHVEYRADFRAGFHDIRSRSELRGCLAPDTYASSQRLAQIILDQGSAGIVYPSVREETHGDCITCFRPALVMNVRKGSSLTMSFENASASPAFLAHS